MKSRIIWSPGTQVSSWGMYPNQRSIYVKFFDVWRWSKTLSTTFSRGSLQSVIVLCGTMVRADGSKKWCFLCVLVVSCCCWCSFVDRYGSHMPFLAVVMRYMLTSMTVSGTADHISGSFCRVEVLLSSVIKKSCGRSRWTFCLVVKAGKVQRILSKYSLYLACCFIRLCETLFCIAAS